MTAAITRRGLVKGALALPLLAGAPAAAGAAASDLSFGPDQAFSQDLLRERARQLAAQPFVTTPQRFSDILDQLDPSAYQEIRFRPDHALWGDGGGPYPIQLYHLGRFFRQSVRVHVVDNGQAREILYSPAMFDFGTSALSQPLPADAGFAGFRVMGRDGKPDWLSFLGASYFRCTGELGQYGLSARGIAVDTAMPTAEEFPRFTAYWLEPLPAGPDSLLIHALLDGPSLTGAYRIDVDKATGVIMRIRADLFVRQPIKRLGVAPLTSLFWFGENNRQIATDWRPEVHDSDGLAIWTGAGERLWRPLNNPPRVANSAFVDNNPKGFGLLQRDRDFTSYEDDSLFFERRPSVWVEPTEGWGEGTVQLVEIPTDDELHDNVVAFWVPKRAVDAGSEWSFGYKLYWQADAPFPADAGHVVSTRLGRGGSPGQPRPKDVKRFVVDFAGGPLAALKKIGDVDPVVSASRGTIMNQYAIPIVGTDHWRAVFDLVAEGDDPVDLRLYLRKGDAALTETWLYQYLPFEYHPIR